jgi:SsrA-binding protein
MNPLAENKKVRFDYEILEKLEAGIELRGFEVKAILSGRANMAGSHAAIRQDEAWLINMDIPPYQPKNTPDDYNPSRTRKLLLKKSEINYLIGKTQEKGLTIVPIKLYTKRGKIKLELALGKSRKKPDKRELIKKREFEREKGRELKRGLPRAKSRG